jgi:hypothetical protein
MKISGHCAGHSKDPVSSFKTMRAARNTRPEKAPLTAESNVKGSSFCGRSVTGEILLRTWFQRISESDPQTRPRLLSAAEK